MNPQHFTISLPSSQKMMQQIPSSPQFSSHFSEEIHRLFGSDFFHILFITFVLSEILLTVIPVQNRLTKQIIILSIGTLLGMTLISKGSLIDSAIQGALAALSSILIVSRFGTRNSAAICECQKNEEKCVIPSHPEHL
jgi:hypothetical protein